MSGGKQDGKPQLPTIITTLSQSVDAAGSDAADDREIIRPVTPPRNAAPASVNSSPLRRVIQDDGAEGNGIASSTAGPSGNSDRHAHARNASLQVPGTSSLGLGNEAVPIHPSSPTLSATSDFSMTETSGTPLQRTALALRDNDPNVGQHGHFRQASIASAFTDASGDIYSKSSTVPGSTKPQGTTDDSESPTSGTDHLIKTPKSRAKDDEKRQERSAVSKEADAEIEEHASTWQKYKALVKGKTRAGRRAAQAEALEQERKRAREIDPAPFEIRPIELADLIDPKNVAQLRDYGGVDGLLAKLGTDGKKGLDLDWDSTKAGDVESKGASAASHVRATADDRERVYGRNILPEKKSKSLLLLMWLALQDKILILLCIAAVVSLALGLYSDFGAQREYISCPNPPPGLPKCPAPRVDWVEGLAILVAVVIVDVVGSLNDWQKERQFKELNAKKEERSVKVIRGGNVAMLNVHEVQVGDVLELEPGEILPCDGVFLRGHNVKCDESGATGESDMIRKVTYEECLQDWEKHQQTGEKLPHRDCFLISGSRCLEGVGEYVVIAVGPTSFHGKLMMALRTDSEITPLQGKLNRLAEIIAYAGTAAGVLLFVALMIRFFIQLARPRPDSPATPNEKAQSFINILIQAVVIIVVAVPEGLPLATTLALAFATKRMTKENLLVRHLSACETSANASVICTDKTGTLTQNEMSVVAGSIGVHLKFALDIDENKSRVDTSTNSQSGSLKTAESSADWTVEQRELNGAIDGPLRALLNEAIAVNSTAFEEEQDVKSSLQRKHKKSFVGKLRDSLYSKVPIKKQEEPTGQSSNFVGSKTETALLKMARDLQWEHYKAARQHCEVITTFPFSSERKAMAVVVKKPEGGFRMHIKGASEVLTKICDSHVEVDRSKPSADVLTKQFDESKRQNVAKTIIFYANQMLRTLALCYRDFESWPPKEAKYDEDGVVTYESLAKDLTLVSIVGIEDPLRPGVRNAVTLCGKAGVQVKMCTGDNALTARSIASQCGIFSPGGIIMEGPVFRTLDEHEMMLVVPRLQVLARCSPEDKKRLVECLKNMDHVVGVTGDGTNDAPALKTANVGFSMGIAGTEVAREASDIILMDDNFESIVTAIMWGRSVNDSVKRFLQFQLSVNIGAVGITFISAVASEREESIFTAVQLLWINLIMDTLAALALATDPASPEVLERKPERRDSPLLTTDMWKMIVGQSIYQFAFILTLNFGGHALLGLPDGNPVADIQSETRLRSLIFNLYVWCQLFNQVSCRSLTRDINFFKGLHRNVWFMAIMLAEIGLQILISFKGGDAFSVRPLTGRDWGICIVGGLLSWPIGVLIRLVPTQPIEDVLIRLGLMPDPNELPKHRSRDVDSSDDGERVDWDQPAIGQVAEKLNTFARIRGGRSRVAFLGKTRSKRMRDAGVHAGNLLALVPGLIGAGIVGTWRPTNPPEASRGAPAAGDPTVSSWQLFEGGKIQIHPQTAPNDTFLDTLKLGAKKGEKKGEKNPSKSA